MRIFDGLNQLRFNGTRRNTVHSDAVPDHVKACIFCYTNNACLGCCQNSHAGSANICCTGSNIDDATEAMLPHNLDFFNHAVNQALQIDIDHHINLIVCGIVNLGGGNPRTGNIACKVKLSVSFSNIPENINHILMLCNIAVLIFSLAAQFFAFVDNFLSLGIISADKNDPCATLDQFIYGSLTEAAGSARNKCNLTFKLFVHLIYLDPFNLYSIRICNLFS